MSHYVMSCHMKRTTVDFTKFTGKCTFQSVFWPAENGVAGPDGPPLISFDMVWCTKRV